MVSAALPATCGAAIEVPDMNTPWLPVPMPVENMLTPGAEISGFKWPSPPRGPAELKDANCPKVGLANVLAVSVAPGGKSPRITASVLVAGPPHPRGTVMVHRVLQAVVRVRIDLPFVGADSPVSC